MKFKYKDLIEMLLPYAEEEINIMARSEKVPADYNNLENWNEVFIDTVRFFRSSEDSNDLIAKIVQKYDADSFDNIEEPQLFEND